MKEKWGSRHEPEADTDEAILYTYIRNLNFTLKIKNVLNLFKQLRIIAVESCPVSGFKQ